MNVTTPLRPAGFQRRSPRRQLAMLRAVRLLLVLLVTFAALPVPSALAAGVDDWLVPADHAIEVDTTGWSLPVDIAFVPKPGPGPKDPLYYVSELRGAIKVVSNDRTVSVYAEDVVGYRPPTELPSKYAEVGLAGLCLDPKRQALFATTVYFRGGKLYNKIVRFDHTGGSFAARPSSVTEFTALFAETPSSVSHQIGKCVIGADGMLYVGVGDSLNAPLAQRLDNPNGKLLRMTWDFHAPKDNPLYDPAAPDSPRSYTYAYGLRNPFAVATDGAGTIYIAENGNDSDRLIEVRAGRNYLWDGTSQSTGAHGIWYWRRSVGPAGMTYIPAGGTPAAWAGRLAVAQGGILNQPGASRDGRTTVNSFPVRAGEGITALPQTVAWFSGGYLQLPVPVAAGPDGLYFSGFLPDNAGETAILKIVPRPGARPKTEAASGEALFRERACEGCHQLQGYGGGVGPALDKLVDRLRERLAAPAYKEQVIALRASQDPVHAAFLERREALLELAGDALVRGWIALRLEEPAFDMVQSAMPNPRLEPKEIEQLTDYLMTLRTEPRDLTPQAQLKVWWDTDRNARPIVAFVLGILLTLAALTIPRKLWRRLQGRREQAS